MTLRVTKVFSVSCPLVYSHDFFFAYNCTCSVVKVDWPNSLNQDLSMSELTTTKGDSGFSSFFGSGAGVGSLSTISEGKTIKVVLVVRESYFFFFIRQFQRWHRKLSGNPEYIFRKRSFISLQLLTVFLIRNHSPIGLQRIRHILPDIRHPASY